MSTMTEQTTTQVYTVYIRAAPEQVWDAITKPEFTQKYFHGSVIESDYAPGSPYRGFAADRSEQYVEGEVLEADPPRLLRTTWRATWSPELAEEPFSLANAQMTPTLKIRRHAIRDAYEAAFDALYEGKGIAA